MARTRLEPESVYDSLVAFRRRFFSATDSLSRFKSSRPGGEAVIGETELGSVAVPVPRLLRDEPG